MTAQIHNDVIVATQHIVAPPQVVFPYFTDPALIVEWIGNQAELDPQPGACPSSTGERSSPAVPTSPYTPYRVVFSRGIPGSDTLPPGGSTLKVSTDP